MYEHIDSNQRKHIHLYLFPAKTTGSKQGGRMRGDDKPLSNQKTIHLHFFKD
jgi:hypothetical protein